MGLAGGAKGMVVTSLRTKQDVTVEWVHSVDDIPASLWQSCFPPPLEGVWWYKTLENSALQEQFRFFYAIIYLNGEACGIAPLFLMDVPLALTAPDNLAAIINFLGKISFSLAHQRTLFVGSPCAEEGTVGLTEDVTLADVADELQTQLAVFAKRLGAKMIVWKDFAEHDAPTLSAMSAKQGLFRVPSFPTATIYTDATNLDAYMRTMRKSRRGNLKKKLRLSEEMGSLEVSVIQRPDQSVLAEVMKLFEPTYEKGSTKFERLGLEFFSEIAKQNEAWFVLLREPEEKKLVAFNLVFLTGKKVIKKFIGLDYSLDPNWFIYFRMWAASVDWALEMGATEIQSGQTGYRGKLETGNTLVPLTNYCCHMNPILHRVFAAISKDVSWGTLDNDLKQYLAAHPELIGLSR
jgi:uncharacterized protein